MCFCIRSLNCGTEHKPSSISQLLARIQICKIQILSLHKERNHMCTLQRHYYREIIFYSDKMGRKNYWKYMYIIE